MYIFIFKGRVGRGQFSLVWLVIIIYLIFFGDIVDYVSDAKNQNVKLIVSIVLLLSFIFAYIIYFSFAVRRIRDIGRPWYHLFLLMVPFYGMYLMVLMLFKKGVPIQPLSAYKPSDPIINNNVDDIETNCNSLVSYIELIEYCLTEMLDRIYKDQEGKKICESFPDIRNRLNLISINLKALYLFCADISLYRIFYDYKPTYKLLQGAMLRKVTRDLRELYEFLENNDILYRYRAALIDQKCDVPPLNIGNIFAELCLQKDDPRVIMLGTKIFTTYFDTYQKVFTELLNQLRKTDYFVNMMS